MVQQTNTKHRIIFDGGFLEDQSPHGIKIIQVAMPTMIVLNATAQTEFIVKALKSTENFSALSK
jgi:hypothetical protein